MVADAKAAAQPPEQPATSPRARSTRRSVISGVGSLGVGAVGGYFVGRASKHDDKSSASDKDSDSADSAEAAASTPEIDLLRFQSTMLVAPRLKVERLAAGKLGRGLLVATPKVGEFSGVLYDNQGQPVWISPDGESMTDLRVQTYRGKPVLTYWAGRVDVGSGRGYGVILDRSYNRVADVRGGYGMLTDLHEFALTDRGTALVTTYPAVQRDLTSVKGPKDGWMFDCHVQEIDVATGEVVFDWTASDHLLIEDSFEDVGDTGKTADNPHDPFHLNSIEADSDTTLLVSARHTHAIYSLDRRTGAIRWQMGGRRSDFDIDDADVFHWQHHARRHSPTTISLFDNHDDEQKGTSRGLVLDIDESAKTVRRRLELRREDHMGWAMGSVDVLPNGNALVGWGTQPAMTEFDSKGTPIWEASGLGESCYRVARQQWTGAPTTTPDIAAVDKGDAIDVSLSWNGATEVARWRVLGGRSAKALTQIGLEKRDGFETTASVDIHPVVQAEALDRSGRVLGRSRVLRVPSALA